jgi:hypothetical protein
VSDNSRPPDAASLLALLVAGDRLPVVAALVLGSRTLPEIAERAGVATRDALRVLTRLESAGLASVDGVNWALHVDVLRAAVTGNRWPAATSSVDDSAAATPQEAAVLRAFLRDGRLLRVPAQRTKRLVILDFLAREFEPGVQYAETEVNQKLTAFHPDYAALRRYLVEEDYLARENGVYWRAGGSVEV